VSGENRLVVSIYEDDKLLLTCPEIVFQVSIFSFCITIKNVKALLLCYAMLLSYSFNINMLFFFILLMQVQSKQVSFLEFHQDDPDEWEAPVALGELWPTWTLRFLDASKHPVELDPCHMKILITNERLNFKSRGGKNNLLENIIVPVSNYSF
jgi:hypothetical protein